MRGSVLEVLMTFQFALFKEYEGRLREEFDRTQGKARSSLKWATIKESWFFIFLVLLLL